MVKINRNKLQKSKKKISSSPSPTLELPKSTQHWIHRPRTKQIVGIVIILIFGASLAGAGFFYLELTEAKKNIQFQDRTVSQSILDEVNRIMILPQDEQPTIATVTDPEQLRDQSFFISSQVGDKVLIYTQARKAILYDPISKKIKDVAPVNLDEKLEKPAPLVPDFSDFSPAVLGTDKSN